MNKTNAKKNKQQLQIANALVPDMEQMRRNVVFDELRARHWRAQWETMFYHIETVKIKDEYKRLLEDERVKQEKYLEELKNTIEESKGELSLEDSNVVGDPSEQTSNVETELKVEEQPPQEVKEDS
jgi:hypothetical protein